LARVLDNLGEERRFNFKVISAAPQEIVQSALEGIVPPDHIFGTRFRYHEATGEADSIIRAAAGWGKISVLEELRANLGISHDHIIYLGDGSSDLPVMMHVNQYDGLTIAESEAKFISRVAKRTVLSSNAMSVLVPTAGKNHELEFCRNSALLCFLRSYVARMGQDVHGHTHNSGVWSASCNAI
jgi:predicted HAD superfamily phosphohydrolase